MGGRGSTRWNDHKKASLAEETPSIDVAALRREGILAAPEASFEMTWSLGATVLGIAKANLGSVSAGRRSMVINTAMEGASEALNVELELVSQPLNWGGVRWFLLCPEPECERRALRVYIDTNGRRIACRLCVRLVHRTTQRHDARLDLARRDAEGFADSRAGLGTERSAMVTLRLVQQAFEAQAAPRRGRGWGRTSVTSFDRVRKALVQECERRHNRPFPGHESTVRNAAVDASS